MALMAHAVRRLGPAPAVKSRDEAVESPGGDCLAISSGSAGPKAAEDSRKRTELLQV